MKGQATKGRMKWIAAGAAGAILATSAVASSVTRGADGAAIPVRAVNKGAMGMIQVTGEENLAIFSGQLSNQPYEGRSAPATVD